MMRAKEGEQPTPSRQLSRQWEGGGAPGTWQRLVLDAVEAHSS